MPRSSLIAAVRSLEAQLGYELFDNTASTTQLTPKGEAYLLDAERQLEKSAKSAAQSVAKPGGKAKASKGRGRAPAAKGKSTPGRRRQAR